MKGVLNLLLYKLTTGILFMAMCLYSHVSHAATATFYSDKYEGKVAASGRVYHSLEYTAAYNKVPLGTLLEITNRKNGYKIIIRVTDRKTGAGIDLSKAAFRALGLLESKGVGLVDIQLADGPRKLP